MDFDIPEKERRELARRHLDSVENWLRAIIEHQLSAAYGREYFSAALPSGTPVIAKRIKDTVDELRTKGGARFVRPIEATSLGDAIGIVLHPELFSRHFREPLSIAFPDGEAVARTFLQRLKTHRDRIAHGGTCGVRDLEQCVCYSNDVVDSLRMYFSEKKMERTFNVPTFTRFVDSRGNDHRLPPPEESQGHFLDVRRQGKGDLFPGDVLTLEVEVDESFRLEEYTVRWLTWNDDRGAGSIVRLPIELRHVGEQMDIRFEVVSAKAWHRLLGACDDRLDIRYRVLPPP